MSLTFPGGTKLKLKALVFVLSLAVLLSPAQGQTCSSTTTTNDLVCAVPQLFGPGGLTLPNTAHKAHFTSSSLNTFRPLNTAVGEALSTLPLGSSGSGVSFTFDKDQIPVPTEDTLGPILTERAGVIGRNKLNVGVAYQYFSFSELDGINLNKFPAVLGHSVFLVNGVQPSFENDYITTNNSVHVALNQTVLYGVYGITNRLDVSAEVPIEQVHFRVTSAAHIVRTVACELNGTCTGFGSQCGEFHYFDAGTNCSNAVASVDKDFANGGDATGLGDVILRGKYQVIKGEKISGSVGIAFRLPSGDESNFLGSGTLGVAPFGALTYRGRLSPHVRVGYQWNGDSILAGDPTATTGAKSSLPPEILYSAGADYRVTKRITVAADLIGGRVLQASRLAMGTFTDVNAKVLPNIEPMTADYSSDAIGVGAKVRLKGRLLLIGNVTSRVNSGGLRASVVPLAGLSYSF